MAHIFPSLTFLIRTLRTELFVTDPAAGDPGREPYIVAHNLILAHAHAEHQGGTIGMTNVSTWYYPYRDIPEDVEAALRAVDFMLGWFVAPVITGDYPSSMKKNVGERLPIFTPEEVKLVKAHRNGKPIGEQDGSSWLYIVPEGLYHLMLHIKDRYNDPKIFITENVNNKAITVTKAHIDQKRMKYHRSHLAYLKKAMEHHVRVKGYFIWSLLDNFERAQGYNSRFGIFYLDYENGRLTRFPKTSAVWWMNFLENPKNPWNRLPLKLQDVETEEERHGPAKKPRSGVA
ncbi:beta-glucosidase-like [Olea europaea subsp. europaea]|uniref:Beta-glucosidase-like n=1 Tax=Olea europaea subsp. europaea TaxID=158383 RepID=A0A8S0U5T7_OLEEU|nr:beta-glucosidase-like [Olea europaea subsp. europaea]